MTQVQPKGECSYDSKLQEKLGNFQDHEKWKSYFLPLIPLLQICTDNSVFALTVVKADIDVTEYCREMIFHF